MSSEEKPSSDNIIEEKIIEKTTVQTISSKNDTKEKSNVEIIEQKHVEVSEDIPPELEALLHTDPSKGLTAEEARQRLEQFGKNELAEVKTNPFLKFLSYFTGAIAYLIEIACIFAAILQKW
ncbi:17398_t:CDS:1, partial [Entrophospora sp. SA101]